MQGCEEGEELQRVAHRKFLFLFFSAVEMGFAVWNARAVQCRIVRARDFAR